VPAESSPTGTRRSVSNILRNLYLVSKKGLGTEQIYQKYFERVSGRKSEELQAFVSDRSLRVARPYYAVHALEHRTEVYGGGRLGEVRAWWKSEGWGLEAIRDNLMEDFDEKHKK
jgi:hypothetical protein